MTPGWAAFVGGVVGGALMVAAAIGLGIFLLWWHLRDTD